ncbi:MAG: hypothetical protein Kow0069_08470 [Promethearchaeota archaeon]
MAEKREMAAKKVRTFEFVERKLRQKTFGVLTTLGTNGFPHATGIIYAVGPPGEEFCAYFLTYRRYQKVHNVEANPRAALLVPFPHHVLRFVPSSCVSFQGTVDVLDVDDPVGRAAFSGNRILAMNLEQVGAMAEPCFLRLRPTGRVHVYGLGISAWELKKNPAAGAYSVEVPR